MGLSKYKEKRSFDQTPEPTGGKSTSKQLRFVIQKHAASHLHYDFRLEMEGVLKSWAVPKGPSLNPQDKRLAMMVEDHPYDYRNFEGIIPAGNYGAGTVIVWDEGTYEALGMEGEDKKTQEKNLIKQLRSGSLKIVMHGKKLKGEFALVQMKGRGENAWLLIKHRDEYASKEDILEKNKSVISKKTIEQMAKTTTNLYGGHAGKKRLEEERAVASEAVKRYAGKPGSEEKNKKASDKKTKTSSARSKKARLEKKSKTRDVDPPSRKASVGKKKKTADEDIENILAKAPKAKFPATILPELATLVDQPFDEPGWIYEVKWDGYRALALSNKGQVELKSRNDKSFNDKFYPVYKAMEDWGVSAVLDGEIVVLGKEGISNFGALQNWRSEADGELVYYVFDLLWYEGKDLTRLPLTERKAVLQSIIPEEGIIRYSESFNESGTKFFEMASKAGLEGIIAKKADSVYHPGERTSDWLKIKSNKRQEMVIGGYTRNEDTSKLFSALLVGYYDNGELIYAGKVGTGFNMKTQAEMMKLFKPLLTKKIPFSETPDVNKPSRFRPNPPHATAYWLKPQLVCEVSYSEMTTDGIMRHPSFEGMRTDKKAKDVVLEKEKPTAKAVKPIKKTKAIKADPPEDLLTEKKFLVPTDEKGRKTLLNPSEATQVRRIDGHELKFTNLDKIFWPKEKYTKRDLINYYYQAAEFILPYLINRPQSMNRFPNGIEGHSFYYKDVTGKAPDWINTYLYHSEADDRDRHYLVCTSEADLLYMINLGCIELNPWSSTIKKTDYPDWCIIDLDPDKNTFEQVITAARVTKEVLDGLGVPSYCKTSGSTGLHIYIPMGAKYTYEQSKEFARVVVTLVNQEIPEFTSLERQVKDRKGKMYLDFLQNRPQATISAPYSVRPKPGATVSMPLHWEEVKKGLKMTDFTIANAIDRMKAEGDIFKPVLGKGVDLAKVVGNFDQPLKR